MLFLELLVLPDAIGEVDVTPEDEEHGVAEEQLPDREEDDVEEAFSWVFV